VEECDVFVCHSGAQKELFRPMQQELERLRVVAFLDQWTLLPGQDQTSRRIVESALSCSVGVIIASRDCLTSVFPLFELFILCTRLKRKISSDLNDGDPDQRFWILPDFFSQELGIVMGLPLPKVFLDVCGIRRERHYLPDHVQDVTKRVVELLDRENIIPKAVIPVTPYDTRVAYFVYITWCVLAYVLIRMIIHLSGLDLSQVPEVWQVGFFVICSPVWTAILFLLAYVLGLSAHFRKTFVDGGKLFFYSAAYFVLLGCLLYSKWYYPIDERALLLFFLPAPIVFALIGLRLRSVLRERILSIWKQRLTKWAILYFLLALLFWPLVHVCLALPSAYFVARPYHSTHSVSNIKSVRLAFGGMVDSVAARHLNGTTLPFLGGKFGAETIIPPEGYLDADDCFKSVRVWQWHTVYQIEFITKRNVSYGPYGVNNAVVELIFRWSPAFLVSGFWDSVFKSDLSGKSYGGNGCCLIGFNGTAGHNSFMLFLVDTALTITPIFSCKSDTETQ
jgi:hypothetical protein